MKRKFKSCWEIAIILTTVMLQCGCASVKTPGWKQTSYGTWNFSDSEVKKLPDVSLSNILSSVSLTNTQRIQVLVKVNKPEGIMNVERLSGKDHVIVKNADGKELRVKLDSITGIQTVRWIKVNPEASKKGTAGAGAVEALSYAPVIPIAIATWPVLRALGLDAGKNAADTGKALMAYGGMSKKQLVEYIGKPLEKFYCKSKHGDYEIWIYRKEQVLRGGRAIFVSLAKDSVYHTSYDTTFFKRDKNCSVAGN